MPGTIEDMSAAQWGQVGTGLSTFASGWADLFTSKDRIERQKKFRKEVGFDIDKYYADFEAGKFDALSNEKMLDAFSFGKQALDINPSLSMAATAMDRMSTDPRMMAAGLGGMNTSATRSMQGLQQQDRANELANAQQYGQYMGGLQGKNEDFRRDLYGQKLTQDQAAYAQAQQNIEQIKANKAAAPFNIIAGGFESVAPFASLLGEDGMKIPKFQEGGDVMQQILASQGEGGIPPRQNLPGEESHEANPISMVAENGEVVGEATGGEIILNSEQTEDIENAVAVVDQAIEAGGEPSMEDLMAVYEAVSDTLSQPQFQDEQQESSSPEQERMLAMLDGPQVA